jgi:hypothetical protein
MYEGENMDASDVLRRIEKINEGCKNRCLPSTKDLIDAGWRRCDFYGSFVESPPSTNGYRVDVRKPNPIPVILTHYSVMKGTLEGATEDDLVHLNDKLEEVEIWLA